VRRARPRGAVADAIVGTSLGSAAVDRLEIAGPGFLNVFLSPAWCAESLRESSAAAIVTE
jgi:arginyl-tRNA synthetase